MNEKTTKTLIFEAALKLFSENGFNSTSIRDIAQMANVNIAAINYHFHSKKELYHFCLQSFDCFIDSIHNDENMVTSQEEFDQLLFQKIDKLLTVFLDNPNLSRFVLREICYKCRFISATLPASFEELCHQFDRLFTKAKEKGWIRNIYSPEILTTMLMSVSANIIFIDAYGAFKNLNEATKIKKFKESYSQHVYQVFKGGIFTLQGSL